jgi:hypothetical protein
VDDAMGQALGRAAVGVQPLGSHPTGFHVETEHDKLGLAVHEGAAVGETAVGETAVEQTGGDEERIVGAAQGIAEGILAALGDQALRDRVSIGVGAPAASLGELYRSYDGARRAVYYRPRREGRIISIWEIQTTANTAWTYPYPKERVLLNLMRSGNTEGSLRLVEDILDSLPAGAGTAQDELFFCQQLVHSLNRYAYEAGIGNQEGGLLRIDLSGDWNFSEARSRIRRAVEQIIAAELDTHNGGDSILDQVLAYIDTHAADRNLQLLDLETAFSYNRYYLSRLIKEKTGSQ